MQYLRKTFTVPTAGSDVSQRRFDYATMSKEKFIEKYGEYTVEPTVK